MWLATGKSTCASLGSGFQPRINMGPVKVISPILPLQRGGSVAYQVTLKTGTKSGAGTNANVYISLVGSRGTTGEMPLDIPNHDDRENGDTDRYTVRAMDVGRLKEVRIRHDNSGSRPGWYLSYVKVGKGNGSPVQFACNRWLARSEGDRKISRTLSR